jgi:Putative beta-barrel porin-2, OmpL-like. bbp2
MRLILTFLFIISTFGLSAQNKNLSFSSYLEVYYLYDFANPKNHSRPSFVYSHNRTNEINLNLCMAKVNFDNEKTRANFALMAGTYSNANLAPEPGVFKNIYEANIGVKIGKTVWLDAGIMPSHIGFESAIGKDCWTLTRSILADNSPYFESGAKITHTSKNEKWTISGLVLNGWQRIHKLDGNNSASIGHQIIYKPKAGIVLNSSSFVGNDKPSDLKQMRYFHNFYGQFDLNNRCGIILGLDTGIEQKSPKSNAYHRWFSPIFIAKYSLTDKFKLAGRLEYYSDKNGVIVSTNSAAGFQVGGLSLNADYEINKYALWRIEARSFSAKKPIFENNTERNNTFITTSLAIQF